RQLMPRHRLLKALRTDCYDVLVIGGGAIGCGCALEAASRGLKTALIEAGDFANGASCKSSKLLEGSNSFLRAAVQGADLQQMFMLQQVMDERATLMRIAPHLNRVQPMLMPIYKPLQLPFYWLGLKLYDAMAGMANVRASHFLSKEETLNEFPLLRNEGLLGSLVYYDGQLDDARMCLALAITAVKHGATVANYVQLMDLKQSDRLNGSRIALAKDKLTCNAINIKCKCVINATGHVTDVIRKLDDCEAKNIVIPTLGTHVAIPSYFGSTKYGLLFPRCQREESMIMLPFENRLVLGSLMADREELCSPPSPNAKEVHCLLDEARGILQNCVHLRANHVLSAWTGVKPSILCPKEKKNCEDGDYNELVSDYLLEVSANQMITLAGGRWSIYRVMASDAVDTAIEEFCLEPNSEGSCTQNLLLDGAEDYCCMLPLDLVQTYDLPMDIAQHLCDYYGSNAFELLQCAPKASRERLHPKFPYILAEVDYACQREYACNLVDVISRRLRAAFVDAMATHEMLPDILQIMTKYRKWKREEQIYQLRLAELFLAEQMGLGSVVAVSTNAKNKVK
ncbi:hypothetical protein KR222_008515, partial [Zaprionus bogoriensis]